jgi:hypothetical protein
MVQSILALKYRATEFADDGAEWVDEEKRLCRFHGDLLLCLLLQYLIQSCARGVRRIVEDMCYEIRRAEACVD